MSQASLQEIVSKLRELSAEERAQLRRLLDQELQAELDVAFDARGLTLTRPAQPADAATFGRWSPVPIQGEPLSASIIRERR